MRLDTNQHMRLDQRMKLAPRMIQSMEILQLPTMALEERIDQELAANPVLERQDSATSIAPDNSALAVPASTAGPADASAPVEPDSDGFSRFLEEQIYSGPRPRASNAGGRDPKMEAMANTEARSESLQEQLHHQWGLVDGISESIRLAGDVLIDYVDDSGYIRESIDLICHDLPPGIRRADIEAAFSVLQRRLEPAGICARSLQECLLLQLDAHSRELDLNVKIPRLLIQHHLHDLEMNRLPQIARRTGLAVEQINAARDFMAKHLNPRPGRSLVDEPVPAVTPDAIVERDASIGAYRIRLTDERMPRLYVNDLYHKMAANRDVDEKTRAFLANNIRNARWIIDAIEQRRSTLLRLLRVVVEAQKDFIEMGPEYLKPLPMTLVADQLGVHVGTVSRAVSEKYIQTPRGIFPLRQFFTGGMDNDAGEAMSWGAMKAVLTEIIAAEDKKNPLSDDAIVEELKKRGITLARRTVAKYRKTEKIPPARRRREF